MNSTAEQFEALIRARSPELYRFALGLCRNPDQAQDLVQETFARAWRSRDKLRDDKAARAWLYTIVRNEHARLYERERPQAWDPAELPAIAVTGYDTSTEAFSLRRALGQLTPDYRQPLLLQVIGGFTAKEIGEILELNTNTVLTRLFRARQALRKTLAPEELATIPTGGAL